MIGESLNNLGRAFLEKEQWTFAAKVFNGALAVLQKTSNEKAQQVVLNLMAEVERRFLDKVYGIRRNINPKIYLERRQILYALRQ